MNHSKDTNIISVDSSLVVKIIPEKSNSFKIEKPREVNKVVYKDNNEQYVRLIRGLEIRNNQKADSLMILRELLKAIQLREYKEIVKDSFLSAKINVKTKGTLESIDFSYKVFPQETKYYEKVIKIKPRYSILGGASIITSDIINKTSIELNAGFQTKTGNILELGINSNKGIRIGYKWNLFTKY